VSDLTPVAVLLVAAAGALVLACLEQLLAGASPSPVLVARRAAAVVRQPLSRPETYDSWLFHLAPPLLLVGAVTALATVPWAPGFRGIDLETGVLVFGAALAYVTPAVFMAGWGAGRPLAVVGGFRFVALMLAYAMPLTMAVTAVATPAESLRPAVIVDVQQTVPMLLAQPLAFALFLPSVMAVAFIAPFDLPQARSELGGGVFSAYTGVQAGMVALAQKVLVLAAAGMTAALFLSGWHGPVLPPAVWMAVKTLGVAALMLWAGRRLPRFEVEPLLSFAWKAAIPAAILAIVWAGLITLVLYR
jgi:NADH-quinone oxidoreductase subunit H